MVDTSREAVERAARMVLEFNDAITADLLRALLARAEKAEADEKIAQHNMQAVNKKWGESLEERAAIAAKLAAMRERMESAEKALEPFAALAAEIEHMASQMPEGDPARSPDGWSKSCSWEALCAAREHAEKYGRNG